MYLRYGLLADAVAPGAQNKKNIIGTFTTILSQNFPCKHTSLSLAFRIEGAHTELGKHHLELAFVDADFKEIGKPVAKDFNLQKEKLPIPGIPLAVELVMEVRGLPLPGPGVYEFVLKIDGRHIGSVPLYVVQVAPTSPVE